MASEFLKKYGDVIIAFIVFVIILVTIYVWPRCKSSSTAGCAATCIDGKCLGCVSDSYCEPEALPRVLREKVGGYIIEPTDPSKPPLFENVPASTVDECISAAKTVGGVCALLDGNQKVCTVFKSTDGIVANYYDKPAAGFTSIVLSKSPELRK
jgi:hypothetical protein